MSAAAVAGHRCHGGVAAGRDSPGIEILLNRLEERSEMVQEIIGRDSQIPVEEMQKLLLHEVDLLNCE